MSYEAGHSDGYDEALVMVYVQLDDWDVQSVGEIQGLLRCSDMMAEMLEMAMNGERLDREQVRKVLEFYRRR